jgi:hypothetical protein
MSDEVNSLTQCAERTRHHLSELLDTLQHQVSPGELVQELVKGPAARQGADIGKAIADQVSRNPLAFLMIAAGVGWLMYSEITGRNEPAPPKRKPAARRAGARRRGAARKKVARSPD